MAVRVHPRGCAPRPPCDPGEFLSLRRNLVPLPAPHSRLPRALPPPVCFLSLQMYLLRTLYIDEIININFMIRFFKFYVGSDKKYNQMKSSWTQAALGERRRPAQRSSVVPAAPAGGSGSPGSTGCGWRKTRAGDGSRTLERGPQGRRWTCGAED